VVVGKKAGSTKVQKTKHENGHNRIPTDRYLQDGSETRSCGFAARNETIRWNGQVGSLVRCDLQNDEGETEFEDALKRHQTPQSVVEPLFYWAEKSHDHQNRDDTARTLRNPAENGEGDGAIDSGSLANPKKPASCAGFKWRA
jgi:hypothetical protein